MQNEGVFKNVWYGLCKNAWFPWQPIADLRIGICLQKYSYLSCYLSLTTKLNLICIFINIMKTLKMRFTNGGICTRSIISQLLLAIDY